jgi:hypothetical protein
MYTLGASPDDKTPCPSMLFEPAPIMLHRVNNGGKDIWGVNWVGNNEAAGAIMPEPNNFILEDVTQWRDVIKAPDLSDVDWEMVAKKELEKSGIDRTQTAVAFNTHTGFFQDLMSFMASPTASWPCLRSRRSARPCWSTCATSTAT